MDHNSQDNPNPLNQVGSLFDALYYYGSVDGDNWTWYGCTPLWAYNIMVPKSRKQKYFKLLWFSVMPDGIQATTVRNTFTGEVDARFFNVTKEETNDFVAESEIKYLEDQFGKGPLEGPRGTGPSDTVV